MTISTAQKIQHELNSLLGLTIINMVCSALALAFGVYFLMPNLITVATTQTIDLNQVALIILGGLAFAVAIKWLISSTEIIEASSELSTNLSEHKKNNTLDDEALTGLIVGLTATYREKKPTLKLMVTISKVACALFALGATLGIITTLMGTASVTPIWMGLSNAGICYAMAAECYIIPHFFGKYSTVWDQRLQETAKAETDLQKALGEA
jgi:hypothetical protein